MLRTAMEMSSNAFVSFLIMLYVVGLQWLIGMELPSLEHKGFPEGSQFNPGLPQS